jgi:hypothetical protein
MSSNESVKKSGAPSSGTAGRVHLTLIEFSLLGVLLRDRGRLPRVAVIAGPSGSPTRVRDLRAA